MSEYALSVVIPTYGRSQTLAQLLTLLDAQTLAPDRFEVVIVDDGSPEPVRVSPEEHRFAIQLFRQENAGPGAARNLAFEKCRAPLVLILNDDALPGPTVLQGHVGAHAAAPPKTAVLGAFPFSENARRSPFVRLVEDSDLLFTTSGLRDGEFHDWRFFWTCNLSLPLEAIRSIGGFDTAFRDPVQEDTELGYRLGLEGWRVLYRADLVCEHEHALTAEAYFRRMHLWGKNVIRMWEKHGDPQILGAADARGVEEALQSVQLRYERYRSVYDQSVARLERLQETHWGQPIPDSVLADARSVVSTVRWIPSARGMAEQLHGADPEQVATHGPAPNLLTSLVLVSFDALENTRTCIQAIRASADPEFPTEIIVVDNGSRDGSVEYLRAQPDVRLIENAKNLGAPRARNQAIEVATGEWLVFLDNDVTVYPEWLKRLRRHAELDPAVGCVVPVADRAAHGQQIAAPDSVTELPAFAARCAGELDGQSTYKSIFSSLLVLVRRDVLERIGGFDERFSPWGFEDDDFSLRVHLAGYRARLAKDVFVHHAHYDGPKSERHRRLLERNWQRFASKWGGDESVHYGSYDFLTPILARSWPEEALRVAPASASR